MLITDRLAAWTVVGLVALAAFMLAIAWAMDRGIVRPVCALNKGLYPMLFVLRMDGVTWEHCEPALEAASAEEIAEAKAMQAGKEKTMAEFEARKAAKRDPMSFVHKFTEVPEAERGRMLWVADEEQARAW